MSGQARETQSRWAARPSTPRFRRLRERRLVGERMDDPAIDPTQLVTALKGIRRINLASGAARSIWPAIRNRTSGNPIRVLDLACGSGDVTLALAEKARRANVPITFEGCDISPVAVDFANETADRRGCQVRFFEHDALNAEMPSGYDVIYCSLFLHHLATSDARKLLAAMSAAAPAIVVNDLIRCTPGLMLAYLGCYALSRSRVVRFDGPVSVAAAFTLHEMREMCADLGFRGYELSWKWPYRFLLTHAKDAPC